MKFDVAQTFKNAHVKPRDLKKLIEETENIIDRVYDTLHEARYPFGPSGAAASTLRLLGDLDEPQKTALELGDEYGKQRVRETSGNRSAVGRCCG